jgi:hypothetical protein
MPIPSLSRGCEIAQFFVRYMDIAPQTKILEDRTNRPESAFEAHFKGLNYI